MPLVIPYRPVTGVAIGERVAVDRRAIPQPGEVAAHLMAVSLAAASRQRPRLEPAQVAAEQLRSTLVEDLSLVRRG